MRKKYNYSVIVMDRIHHGDLTNVTKKFALEQAAKKGECVVYRFAYGKLKKVQDFRPWEL